MLNLICKGVERIVFSGIDGKILVPLLIYLLWIGVGQAKDFIKISKEIFGKGV